MRKLVGALLAAAVVAWAPAAWAVAYTIGAVTPFNNLTLGISGTINPASLSGTVVCLTGTCGTSVSHDWLVFTVTLGGSSNDVDEIAASAAGVAAGFVGVAYINGAGAGPIGASIPIASQGLWNYDHPNTSAANLENGETTDVLIAVFTLGSLPGPGIGPIPPGTANIRLSKASGANFSQQAPIAAIPEPGTFSLLAAGLLALGLTSRRRA